jgi:hypothetical protein
LSWSAAAIPTCWAIDRAVDLSIGFNLLFDVLISFDALISTEAFMDSFEKLLDKSFEKKKAVELVDAPVSALSGVSESDAALLAKAFGIKTIGDLASNKFFVAAKQIVDIAARSGR